MPQMSRWWRHAGFTGLMDNAVAVAAAHSRLWPLIHRASAAWAVHTPTLATENAVAETRD